VDEFLFNFRRHRYTAYRQFVRWCWHFLGREVRVVLPSCVVHTIRTAFPSDHYTGFHQADSDWTWMKDSELPVLYRVFQTGYTVEEAVQLVAECPHHSYETPFRFHTLSSSSSKRSLQKKNREEFDNICYLVFQT